MKNRYIGYLRSKQGKSLFKQFFLLCAGIYIFAFLLDHDNFFVYFLPKTENSFKDRECSVIKNAQIAVNQTHVQVYVKTGVSDSNIIKLVSSYLRLFVYGDYFNHEIRVKDTTPVDISGKRFVASFSLEQNGLNNISGYCLSSKLFQQSVQVTNENTENFYTFVVNNTYIKNACVSQDTLFFNTQSHSIAKNPIISSNFVYSQIKNFPNERFKNNKDHLFFVSTSKLSKWTTKENQTLIEDSIKKKLESDNNLKILFFRNQERTDVCSSIKEAYNSRILAFENSEPICFSSIESL